MIKKFLSPEGHQNPISGSKVTALLLKGFVITNDKASYVAKGDCICLLSVAKEIAMNEQQIKPCVPLL